MGHTFGEGRVLLTPIIRALQRQENGEDKPRVQGHPGLLKETILRRTKKPAMVVYTFGPSAEAEAGKSLTSRLAWST